MRALGSRRSVGVPAVVFVPPRRSYRDYLAERGIQPLVIQRTLKQSGDRVLTARGVVVVQ